MNAIKNRIFYRVIIKAKCVIIIIFILGNLLHHNEQIISHNEDSIETLTEMNIVKNLKHEVKQLEKDKEVLI